MGADTPPSPRPSTLATLNNSPAGPWSGHEEVIHETDHRHRQSGPLGIHNHHPHAFFERRRSSNRRSSERRRSSIALHRIQTGVKWWKFHLRDWNDEDEQDWWFASTAIPLLAATIGPLANVLSIAALVTSWRMCLVPDIPHEDARRCAWHGRPGDGSLGPQLEGQDFADPRWCYWLNVASLVVGFVGNFFLLCNFTNRIRYIIALPVTILCWYFATGILIGITVAMQMWEAPVRPQQTYTQGFWYAVIAACMYMICAMLLMVNMLGYFLGHYPQHFTLTESQRTLILQTMLFFVWLAGGAAVFSAVEMKSGNGDFNWSYVNALYFCDVTILTVGFGDLYPTSNTGRGLVLPYSVGGIIMLGLVVASISKFATELGTEKVIKRHAEKARVRTTERSITTSVELDRRNDFLNGNRPVISAPFDPVDQSKPKKIGFSDDKDLKSSGVKRVGTFEALSRVGSMIAHPQRRASRKPKLLLLREERDRFDAMRRIQHNTTRFKNWSALFLSVSAFGILWCIGAVVFWQCEKHTQNMTYFQALYFCYVSLLTIGYGDLSPKSNAGRPFFLAWSLIAVPTITILISSMGDTVINRFKDWTSGVADFTVLPQKGIWRAFLNRYPLLLRLLTERKQRHDERKRLEEGFQTGPAPEEDEPPTIDELAKEEPTDQELAKKLARMIRKTANDVKEDTKHHYSYEEWVEITQLIRFTAKKKGETLDEEEAEDGMVEWDWIGEDSPMMANESEAAFVLDRLCESLSRYVKKMSNPVPDTEVVEPVSTDASVDDIGPKDEKGSPGDSLAMSGAIHTVEDKDEG